MQPPWLGRVEETHSLGGQHAAAADVRQGEGLHFHLKTGRVYISQISGADRHDGWMWIFPIFPQTVVCVLLLAGRHTRTTLLICWMRSLMMSLCHI